jgi:competence protein ComEC
MNRTLRSIIILALLVAALAAAVFILRRPLPQTEPGPASGKLVVRFLDVGQGDSELIQLPDGETILIDSGDRGAPTVELLRRYGVKELSLVIATHPHSDHIGEMRDVMRAFKVLEFWDSGFSHTTKTYGDMLQEIKDRGIKFSTPKRGDQQSFGSVLVEVLNPGADFSDDEPNNASVVIKLSYGQRSFLFTGDAEITGPRDSARRAGAWGEMMAAEREMLRADVLKASHHGSSNGTNREVLDSVQPSIVIVSCAAGNEYHHPNLQVVRMLAQVKDRIKLFRTDLEGTITAVCDGSSIDMTADRQVTQDRLYLTGDEVAGTVANGARDGSQPGKHSGRKAR